MRRGKRVARLADRLMVVFRLNADRDWYGYDLWDLLGRPWNMYTALAHLERDGQVTRAQTDDGRTTYRLSIREANRAAYERELNTPWVFNRTVHPITDPDYPLLDLPLPDSFVRMTLREDPHA